MTINSSTNVSHLTLSVDAPAHEALDAPLDSDLGHGQAAALRPLVLLVEGLAKRVTGGRSGGGVVPGIHPPRDVHSLRGVGRGPGAGGGHGARGPGVGAAGLDGHRNDALLLLSARVRQTEPQVLLGLGRGPGWETVSLEQKRILKKKTLKNCIVLTSVGLFESRILRAFEEEINELRPFFTSAFRAFLSGAEYFLASSMSLQSKDF